MPMRKTKQQIKDEKRREAERQAKLEKAARQPELRSGFLLPGQQPVGHTGRLESSYSLGYDRRNTVKSKPDTELVMKATPRYKGEMAEREAEAKKEIEKKKKQTGVLFNKGGYQYITEGMDPTTLGKK